MRRKIYILILLSLITAISWMATQWFSKPSTEQIFQSAVAVLALYIIFNIGIGEFASKRITSSKTRYSFRKTISIFSLTMILIVLLRIWVPNPQALLVAYGVVAAGIAIALQDLVKNFAGSIVIFLGGLYSVGNRIKINGISGDVIDIDLFNTTLLEIRGWIEADQATGRITTVPNGVVLNTPVQNFTKQHKYLWDEMSIVVTPESDWSEAMRLLEEISLDHTKEYISDAEKSLTKLERYYYVEGRVLEPNVYIKPHNNGYELTARYVVNAWKRRSTNSDIWGHIIRVFNEHHGIEIAPTTYALTQYPNVSK